MAQYKVPQDVEADDKLIGPFSFRQFVYLLIAAGLIALAVGLFQLFPLLAIIPLPPVLLFLALALILFAPKVGLAEPSIKVGKTTVIKESLDANAEAAIKAAGNTISRVVLEDCSDQDLAKLCELYPTLADLKIDRGKRITNIAPLAKLENLTELDMRDCKVADLTPLAKLTKLKRVEIDAKMANLDWMSNLTNLTYVSLRSDVLTSLNGLPNLPKLTMLSISHAKPDDLSPIVRACPALKTLRLHYTKMPNDLSELTKLANLKELDFYGATVPDFSALAKCPMLKKIMYYATKGADYSTLGKLTQVEDLHGGLTQLKDISWIANLPNLKRFTMFAEFVKDYSPLATTKLDYLKIWSMKEPVDLVHVGKISTLKELEITGLENAKGSKEIGNLTNLTKLTISDYNKKKGGEDYDFALFKNLNNLTNLTIRDTSVKNFAELAHCSKLKYITLNKVNGIEKISVLKDLPNLKTLIVYKDAFPAEELAVFGDKVKIR